MSASKKAAKSEVSTDEESSADAAPASKSSGKGLRIALALALLALAGGGAFVAWHRQKDPARAWVAATREAHERKLERRLVRCMGSTEPSAIRGLLPDVRAGRWPAAMRECTHLHLIELEASPMDFASDLLHPPESAERAKTSERDSLERLRIGLGRLRRAVGEGDRSAAIPNEARDPIANAVEEIAGDVQTERGTFNDLLREAEASARWW